MALKDLIDLSLSKTQNRVIDLSEERAKAQIDNLRKYIAFWREYPDLFVDFLCGDNPENFKLYTYQRIFLRQVMRHRYAYATFPRASMAPDFIKKFDNFSNNGNPKFMSIYV